MEFPPVLDLYFTAAVAAILLIAIGTLVADLRLAQILISEQCTLHTDELKRIKTRLLRSDGIPRTTKEQDMSDAMVERRPQSRGRMIVHSLSGTAATAIAGQRIGVQTSA
ncbi:hypothetical protein LTR29_012431 [Friedmanniomyces endolithicus]|nr:hypothetical protein LTR29_012431 [Friedmanniomyces endolithicus]